MNAIVPFQFENQPMRVIEINGQPWFVLADVCLLLGIRNPSQAAARLDASERSMFNIGRQGETIVVSLAGLLTIMLRCKGAMKPETMPYRLRKFITAEVMPSVLHTGSYAAPGALALPRDPRELLAYLAQQAGDMVGLQDTVAALTPKADALDRLAGIRGAVNVTEAAKVLKTTRDELFRHLHAIGWTYRGQASGRWQCHADKERAGLVEQRMTRIPSPNGPDRVSSTVMVTPKGLAKLAEQLEAAR